MNMTTRRECDSMHQTILRSTAGSIESQQSRNVEEAERTRGHSKGKRDRYRTSLRCSCVRLFLTHLLSGRERSLSASHASVLQMGVSSVKSRAVAPLAGIQNRPLVPGPQRPQRRATQKWRRHTSNALVHTRRGLGRTLNRPELLECIRQLLSVLWKARHQRQGVQAFLTNYRTYMKFSSLVQQP